jgi:hypothetical protein
MPIVLLGVVFCVGGYVHAQSSISPLAQAVCSPVSDIAPYDLQLLKQALLQAGSAIESDLINAFNSGPPASAIAAITSGATIDFANIQAWLGTNAAAEGMDSGTTASILSQTPQELAQSEANLFAFQYQSNALTYLAPIAGTAGNALLARLASNPNSPFQSIAKAAIANKFGSLWAAYEAIGAPKDNFSLQAAAVLSPGNSINPVSSDTIVRIGTFVALIPSGSFAAKGNNVYAFSGTVSILGGGTANLTMSIAVIDPLPALAKQFGPTLLIGVEGSGVNLSGLPTPVQAGLMLGSTGGTTTAFRL